MQGVENASVLVDEDARNSNTQWMAHLDANGLHLSVPFELLCCGVRDVREVVAYVYSPPDGDIRCGDFVAKNNNASFGSNIALTARANLRLSFFERLCVLNREHHWRIRKQGTELSIDRRDVGELTCAVQAGGFCYKGLLHNSASPADNERVNSS